MWVSCPGALMHRCMAQRCSARPKHGKSNRANPQPSPAIALQPPQAGHSRYLYAPSPLPVMPTPLSITALLMHCVWPISVPFVEDKAPFTLPLICAVLQCGVVQMPYLVCYASRHH